MTEEDIKTVASLITTAIDTLRGEIFEELDKLENDIRADIPNDLDGQVCDLENRISRLEDSDV